MYAVRSTAAIRSARVSAGVLPVSLTQAVAKTAAKQSPTSTTASDDRPRMSSS
jgi:hypothetical protein